MLSDMTSRTDRKERTHAHLLAAAREVITTKGFAATTARDVAAAAGVAVGTVFVHFPTMARLAEAVLDETVGTVLDEVGDGSGDPDLVAQLLEVSTALYAAYRAETELSHEVLSASLFEATPGGPSQRRLAAFRDWVAARVQIAVDEGQIAPIDPDTAFAGFFALYFGVLTAGLRGDLDPDGQHQLLESLLRRFLGAPAPQRPAPNTPTGTPRPHGKA
jgi:AcrR family transcriptional regulator